MYKNRVNKKIAKKRIKNKFISIIFFLILPVIIFIISIIFLLNLNSFKIVKRNIAGSEYLDLERINKIIDKNLEGKNLFLINRNNFIFYPEDKIIKNLKEDFVEIDNVEISYDSLLNWKEINIKIKQKEKKYLWCQSDKKEKCNFVSNSGAILGVFNKNKTNKKKEEYIYFLGNIKKINNKKYTDIFENEIIENKKIKNIFLDKKDFIDLEKLIEKLLDSGLKIKKIKKIELGDYIVETKSGVKIIFPRKYSDKVYKNFKDILKFEDISFDKKNGEFSTDLDYINMLFGKSIVYCLKKDICVGNYK